jgi:ADP-ribose pyrophosphatase YjhB (NUDIX family)
MSMTLQADERPMRAMPFTRIELAVLAVHEGVLQVLLGRREEPPFSGRWALPGGVLRIDLDATLDDACQRVARERLEVGLPDARQLMAVGGRKRDPRAPWALSVVYRCCTPVDALQTTPGKRLAALRWQHAAQAAQDSTLAFDHADLIGRAVLALQADVEDLRLPLGLLAEPFTLTELQMASEAVLGRPLDKSSFRRRIDAAGTVEPVSGEMRTGPFRPAQVFRLAPRAA